MADFPIFHGITLAANSFIENLNVELLEADPVPVAAGRVWFNSTDKVFKYSGIDATGGVIIRTFKDAESAAIELAALDASSKAYADARKAEAVAHTDAVKQELLGGIPPETLDTITEIAAALRDNPDIVNVLETKIGTDIAAAKAELKGTVTEAMDTLGEIETAVSALQSAVSGATGNLATLTTDAKSTLVAAINEVDAHVDAEAARAATAEALIRTDYNARRVTFQSAAAATTHTIAHNLGSEFVDFTVLVQRADGKYRNDVVSVEEVDNNTLKVYLAVACNVKVAMTAMTAL